MSAAKAMAVSKEAKRQVRILKRLTAEQVAEVAALIVTNDVNSLDRLRRDRAASALQVWIASVAKEGIRNGDGHALDTLLTRMIGRPKEKIEISGPDGEPIPVTAMTREERLVEIERLRKRRELAGTD